MKIIAILDYKSGQSYSDKVIEDIGLYADVIWCRFKNVGKEIIFSEAAKLRKLFKNKTLTLSEHAEVAHELSFDGVHLNKRNFQQFVNGPKFSNLVVGYSAHSFDEIWKVQNSADYCTLSPIFPTKDYSSSLGAVDISNLFEIDVYALGGISCQNVELLQGMGYTGVAGISFVNELDRLAIKVLKKPLPSQAP